MSKKAEVEYTLETFAEAEYRCRQLHHKYQAAADELKIIETHEKDILADIKIKIAINEPNVKWSEAKLETHARASKEWKQFRLGQEEAIRAAGAAKAKYYSAVRYFECIQSGLAYKRTELSRIS